MSWLTSKLPSLWGRTPGAGAGASDSTDSSTSGSLTLDDVIDKYDLVEIDDNGTVIVTQAPQGTDPQLGLYEQQTPAGYSMSGSASDTGMQLQSSFPDRVPHLGEIGVAGSTAFRLFMNEEYNSELRGRSGLLKYNEMKRNDSQVRSALRLVKTPILSARWFIKPASHDEQDLEIARFIEWNLFEGMTQSWPQLLQEILHMLDYGYYPFEKVFDILPSGRIGWRKFGPRHPIDIVSWEYDAQGGPDHINFMVDDFGNTVQIPISKLLVFIHEQEGMSMHGMSVLRSAYKHWYFKENLYKIDAVQNERHGVGIPVIKLPPNFDKKDRDLAHEMGRNLRTNEKAHVVLPPNWEVEFAQIFGRETNALESAEHHGNMIFANVLGQFTGATEMRVGSDRAASQRIELFDKSVRFVAEVIRDVFNKWAIRELVNFNWPDVEQYPELRVHRIGDTRDWREFSFAMRNLIGAGVIEPDDRLEEWVREEMDLPDKEFETIRQVATPQMPDGDDDDSSSNENGQAGPPRQSQARNTDNSPGNNGRVGQDQSGTS